MLLAVLLAAAVFQPRPILDDCMCYMYVNANETQQVWISQVMFESLVQENWCVKVYTKQDGGKTVHVCKI